MIPMKSLVIAATLILSPIAIAETLGEAVESLQTQWSIDNYQLDGKPQLEGFENLLEQADQKLAAFPNSAELYIWRGIIKSTYAGVKGGLGALKYAKSAKSDLETAMQLDADALQGSAYTSLGALYYNVPGWPLGFGNDDKAEELLLKALQINPAGIDANYFYGDFLRNKKRYAEAKQYMEKALEAPPRPGRPLADEGRKREIQRALLDIQRHL